MKGVYLLFLRVKRDCKILVGGLGEIYLRRGVYVYVGSAQNNLEKRIFRHVEKHKKVKWHIDYVTVNKNTSIFAAYAYLLPKRYECRIARELMNLMVRGFKGFGASDCKCFSHFFEVDREPEQLIEEISERIKASPIIVFKFR